MNKMLAAAINLAEAGFAVHFQKGKKAFEKDWNAKPPKTANELQHEYSDGLNIAFRAGEWSQVAGLSIIVLDVDIRSEDPKHIDEARQDYQALVGNIKPTVKTGGGGYHLYLKCPKDKIPKVPAMQLAHGEEIGDKKYAWQIEVLSAGHGVTAPPSIHPVTGQAYQWANGGLNCLCEIPESLIEAILKKEKARELSSMSTLSVANIAISGKNWPDPEPIRNDLLPVFSLPMEILPTPYKDWLADMSYRMNCPIDFVAASSVVVTSAIIGAGCGIKPKQLDDWLVIPNLWGGIVGRPSMLKSPSLNESKKPLIRLQMDAKKEFDEAIRDYELEAEISKGQRETLKKEIVKAAIGKNTKAGLNMLEAKHQYSLVEEPIKPIWRRYETNDATIEKMGELLAENPRGILLFNDELIGLLAGWDKEGHEVDRAFYLEAFNGYGSKTTDRIGRGTIHVDNLCVSLLGGIQPTKLLTYLYQAMRGLNNDGLVQRLQLLVYPDEPKQWELRDKRPNHEAKNKAFEIMQKLAFMDFIQYGASQEDGDRFPYFHFAPDAQMLFNDWLTDLECNKLRNTDENPIIQEHLAKYRSLMPSLALIFHLIDIADGKNPGPVTKASAEKAAAWCDYLESHARRIYGMVMDVSSLAASKLAEKIKGGALGDKFTTRDVYRKNWHMLNDRDIAQVAVNELVDAKWLYENIIPPAYGQKGKIEYLVNPKVKN